MGFLLLVCWGFFVFFFNPHICPAANLGKREKKQKNSDTDESCDSTFKIILGGEMS